jgi:ATP-binding cassette subfamily F protein 3
MATLIQVQSIHKTYGPRVIFDDASVDLADDDRVGLIGRNGAGKTTLCRLILGREDLDGGQIVKSSRLRLGYLEQESPFGAEETAIEYLLRVSGKESWRCAKMAGRFHLGNAVLARSIGSLPGGYQTRVKLIAMLLAEPNFLVLDEPTNYLDLKTLMLLERFLADFSGGYLVVSHDREFLKRTCERTLEVENGRLFLFPGDVEGYIEWKDEQRQQIERFNKNVEAARKHLQRFVDRFRVRASTASRAQSKLKQLSRLHTIEIEHPMRTARIKIPPVEEKKGVALRCEDLAIGYSGREVAREIRFEIERGRHVAVLGDNGQGKTTLLRTIAGEIPALSGSFQWGHATTSGYYAQHVYAALDAGLDVRGYLVRRAAHGLVDEDILDMAGSFLFRDEELEKPLGVLSGGERARLCLAGLLLSRRPVLLLDEPTNHLDFETVEALGNALRRYAGTIFFVCHDRTFVKLLATNILEVREGRVTLFPGDYDAFVYRTEREIEEEEAAEASPPARDEGTAEKGSGDYRGRKELKSRIQRLKRRLAELDAQMAACDQEVRAIHQHFIDRPLEDAREKTARLQELGRVKAEAESEWLAAGEELERLGEA